MNYEYEVASALALEACEFSDRLELTDSDRALVERFLGETENLDERDFWLDYYNSVYEFGGRRFIVGDDGDFYMIEGSTVYYVEVESCVGFPDGPVPSSAL